jgi:hypothetical protein
VQGALRGVGRQLHILAYNLAGFWGVGVSTGTLLTFVGHRGLPGIWVGLTAGVAATAILNVAGLLAVRWRACAMHAAAAHACSPHASPRSSDSPASVQRMQEMHVLARHAAPSHIEPLDEL